MNEQRELCKVTNIREEEFFNTVSGKIEKRLVAQLTRMVKDPFTGTWRPTVAKANHTTSELATTYNRAGELVENPRWATLVESHREGYAFPAVIGSISSSNFKFLTDPEGMVRNQIRVMVVTPEGEEAEDFNVAEALLRQAAYQLRGTNAVALDINGNPVKERGITLTYKGMEAVAATETEWTAKKAEAQANAPVRERMAEAMKTSREAKMKALAEHKANIAKGVVTEPPAGGGNKNKNEKVGP